MKYKNIIFDLDNTILDFSYAEKLAFKNVVESYNLNYEDDLLEVYRSINEPLWRSLERGEIKPKDVFENRFSLFFKEYGIEVNGLEAEYNFRDNLALNNKTIPHAQEVLNELKKENHNLYIATNGFSKTQRERLKKANLFSLFNDIFISEEIGYEKPNVNFFNKVFNGINEKDKSNLIMIGDNETSDIKGANNFKIDSILFTNKENVNTSATYTINDLRDVLTIVEG